MNILLIGYGSIGKRHEEVLLTFSNIDSIEIVTTQNLTNKITFNSLNEVKNLNKYDYFIIASETSKHFIQLLFLENSIKNKIIFCEKPLFDRNQALEIINNKVFVGYVLRFYPLLKKLKKLTKNEKIINMNVSTGQYLPSWRPNRDYRKSYSASKIKGGGVLLDLSHELDYIQWFSGKLIEIKSYQVKVSDLEIDSDDLTTFIGRSENGTIVNLSIDYISKISHRSLHIDTLNNSYFLDFMANKLIQKDKQGHQNIFTEKSLERNDMFIEMHKSILNKENNLTNYHDAKNIMNTIMIIQEQNK